MEKYSSRTYYSKENKALIKKFSSRLIRWQKNQGRHDLPWQCTEPYKVWVSELMLQQTQVSTVLKYFSKFIAKFPTVQDLANATQDEVYEQWSGLGYYRRARFLHAGAKQIVNTFNGVFPTSIEDILSLPGVGKSTAHAIAAFCYNQQVSILDGNVQRTLARIIGYTEYIDTTQAQQYFWALAAKLVPKNKTDMPAYTQGLMDFGATLCTPKKPLCDQCPFQKDCVSFKENTQTNIPKKKPKKAIPLRIFDVFYYEKFHDGLAKHGFIQYKKELGVWEHLYGPIIKQNALDSVKPDFILNHTFSHFKAEFRVFVNKDKPPKQLYWKTPQDWLKSGIPSPVGLMIQKITKQSE